MRITGIGGGPGGLFSAILLKKALPDAQITVHEQNGPEDAFGFGVVFSDETLLHIEAADPESFAEIQRAFIHWRSIETWHRGAWVKSDGHGFSGLERRRMLQILQQRAAGLGIGLRFHSQVPSAREAQRDADLVIAADGVNSRVREELKDVFKPRVELGATRFSWLAVDRELESFTFIFAPTEFGNFSVHAYPFKSGQSTWIVECTEDTWRRAGFEESNDEKTLALCQRIFTPWLGSSKLVANRSLWRRFPFITNERWHDGRSIALVGDAVHTAHFSIGSGTKLAMEGAIALSRAVVEAVHQKQPMTHALERYESLHRGPTERLQRNACVSQRWFEEVEHYLQQSPHIFNFNLMTRSRRIGADNLAARDPVLVRDTLEAFAKEQPLSRRADGSPVPPAFSPFKMRGLELPNRVVVSPMCQYSAEDGVVGDWHLVHLGSRAIGGAGLLIAEMTNVSADGRISRGCAGLWTDAQEAAYARIVDFVHQHSAAKIGVQLAHAGRKGSAHRPWEAADTPLTDGWETIAPSALAWNAGWPAPRAMTRADMDRVRDAFVASARRAVRAGFDMIELHMAHGYLLSSFLTPLSNQRTDEYGGSLENRLRFPLEVLDAVRSALPKDMPLSVRISAHDWHPRADSMRTEESVRIARALREHGADIIDVSSGGTSPEGKPQYGRMYQLPFAEAVRRGAQVPVMAVGGIESIDHVNTIVLAGRADLCAIARAHLADPMLTQRAAIAAKADVLRWPAQYSAGKPRLA
jgi:anthraniloyl-CoA monooxygenase